MNDPITAADVRRALLSLVRAFDFLIETLAVPLVALLILTVYARTQEPRA